MNTDIVSPAQTPPSVNVPRYSYYALAVLTLVNFLNYIDRQVLPAVAPYMHDDPQLRLKDTELGLMEMVLLLSYTILAPIFGRLGDKYPRAKLMAIAAVIWSFVTALTGIVELLPFLPASVQFHVPRGLHLLFGEFVVVSGAALAMCAVRACVGVGESAYSTITPSLIADYFPPQKRATALGIFQAAIPMGFALGFVIGGVLANFFGWRIAFMIVGIPGLIAAALVWKLKEPKRGATFGEDNASEKSAGELDSEINTKNSKLNATDSTSGTVNSKSNNSSKLNNSNAAHESLHDPPTAEFTSKQAEGRSAVYLAWRIIRSRDWLFSTLGYTMLTAALGAFATWAVTLLVRDKGMSKDAANIVLGVVVLLAGATGTFGGGWLADKLATGTEVRRQRIYFLVCAVSTFLGIFPALIAIISGNKFLYLPAVFLAVALLFTNNAPFHAILLQSVPVAVRSLAIALNIVTIHTFGDAISRFAVGVLSDSLKEGNLTALARFGAMLGVDPATHNLSVALLIAPAALAVGSVFLFIGAANTKRRSAR
jgi:MFS family permease